MARVIVARRGSFAFGSLAVSPRGPHSSVVVPPASSVYPALFAARFATDPTRPPTRRPDKFWKDVNNHKRFLEEMATEIGLKEVRTTIDFVMSSDNYCCSYRTGTG